jgi:hypothetical protein
MEIFFADMLLAAMMEMEWFHLLRSLTLVSVHG